MVVSFLLNKEGYKEVINMKKMLLLLLGISMIAFGKEKSDIKIGVTQIMEHQSLDSARKGFIKASEKDRGGIAGRQG